VGSTQPAPSTMKRSSQWLSLAGGIAAATLFSAFLIGILGVLLSRNAATDNWLVILLRLNLQPTSVAPNALTTLSLLDVSLMLLFGLVMASMYTTLSLRTKVWATIAVALPFLGVPVFLATGTAGRSAVLLAGLISSALALRNQFSTPAIAYSGILASVLLLIVGDFGTAAFPRSAALAAFIGIGYLLWLIWLLLLTLELFRRARQAAA
jgi:hypothetical protein